MNNIKRNIIQCCNNTHQGAPLTGKRARTLPTSVTASQVTCFYKEVCENLSKCKIENEFYGAGAVDMTVLCKLRCQNEM